MLYFRTKDGKWTFMYCFVKGVKKVVLAAVCSLIIFICFFSYFKMEKESSLVVIVLDCGAGGYRAVYLSLVAELLPLPTQQPLCKNRYVVCQGRCKSVRKGFEFRLPHTFPRLGVPHYLRLSCQTLFIYNF